MLKKFWMLSLALVVANSILRAQDFVSYPYTEDFESDSWIVPLENLGFGSIDSAWTRSNVSGYSWRVMQGTDAFPYSGPVHDYSTSWGKYMISFGEGVDSTASLISPWIDLSTAQYPEFRFAEYRYGSGISRSILLAQRYGNIQWDTVQVYYGGDKTSTVEAWNYHSLDVASFAGDSVRFRFDAIGNGLGIRGVAMDAIHLSESDSCWLPSNVSSPSKSQASITLSWSNPNGDSTYFRVLSTEDSFFNDTLIYVGTGQGYTIYPLKSSTEYMFWGTSSCALRNGQRWGDKFVESTTCNYKTTPYFVGFEGGGWQDSIQGMPMGSIGPCWTVNGHTSKQWEVTRRHTPLQHYMASPPNGSRSWIQYEGHDSLPPTLGHLNSPDILVGAGPQYLSFWYNVQGNNTDKLRVYVTRVQTNQTTVLADLAPLLNTTQSTWNRAVFDLSPWANQRVRVFFRGIPRWAATASSDMVVAIDEFQISASQPCSLGIDLGLLETDVNSASIVAKAGGSALLYEYGPKGYIPGTGTIVQSLGDTILIGGLMPETAYDFYAQTTCGSDTMWTSNLSFSTQCIPNAAPYIEDFEGLRLVDDIHPIMSNSWVISRSVSLGKACWNLSNSFDGMVFSVGSAKRPLGSFNDHTRANGKYLALRVQRYTADPFYTSWAITPAIDLDTLRNPELEYAFKLFSTEAIYGDVFVRVYDSIGYVRHKVRSDSLDLNNPNIDWRKAKIDLTPFANRVIRIEFEVKVSSYANGLSSAVFCVDDLSIKNPGRCPSVYNLVSTAQTQNSVTLNWESYQGTAWVVSTTEVGSSTIVTDTVYTDSITLASLNPSARYQIAVSTLCGDTVSEEEIIVVETACGVVTTPYYESFDNENWVLNRSNFNLYLFGPCWQESHFAIGDRSTVPFFNSPYRGDHTTGDGMYLISDQGSGSVSMISPTIDLSGLAHPELRMWTYFFTQNYSDSVVVSIKRVGSSSWTVLGSLATTSMYASEIWKESEFDLSNFINDTVEIKWEGNFLGLRSKFGIDDVSIDEKSTCGSGPTLSVNPLNGTSAEVDWDDSSSDAWILSFGEKGSSTSSYDTIHLTHRPYVIKGLDPWKEYEFRIRAVCDSSSVSFWGSPAYMETNSDGCFYSLELSSAWTTNANAVELTAISSYDTVVQRFPFHGPNTAKYTVYIPDSSVYSLKLVNPFTSSEMSTVSMELMDPSEFSVWSLAYQSLTISDTTVLFSDTSLTCDVDCIIPLNLEVNSVEYTTASITWISLNDSSEVFLGQVGSSPQGGVYHKSLMEVDTLIASSDYWFFVRDHCVDTTWVGPLLLQTKRCTPPLGSFTYSNNWSNFTFQSDLQNDTDAFSFNWDFGDGITDSISSPTHTYNASGDYSVQLIYTNKCNQSDTSIQVVRVCDSLFADFSTQLTTGSSVSFDNSNSYGWLAEIYWDFGDGTSSTASSPTHAYGSYGVYNVFLRLVDSCGNVDSVSQVVQVCRTPISNIQISSTGFNYVFDGSGSLYSDGYRWDINGHVFTSSIVNYSFPGFGSYSVRFRNWNGCNSLQDTSFQVEICAPVQAQWTVVNVSQGSTQLKVEFDATLSIADKYHWDFGDGSTDSSYLVTHTYSNPNQAYTVQLVVESVCGDRDTLTKTISFISLTERANSPVSIYPNPSRGDVYIQFSDGVPRSYQLSLNAADGKLVSSELPSQQVDSNTLLVSLSLAKGVYYIVVVVDGVQWAHRVVIQ
ncbi:MAG: PKD domain-containing protein [Bacteroidetes bacterium]|nr:MAG: PKD domain-containing protein [Bacteroidota bacterium]